MHVKPTVVSIALAALTVALFLAAPEAGARKRAPCTARHDKTVLATDRSRVFTVPAHGERVAYACLYKKNRRRRLGLIGECQNETQASDFRLGGPYVGYEDTVCGLVAGSTLVKVLNLKTGRVKYSAPGATGTASPSEEASFGVSDFEMKANGSIVWIGSFDQDSNGVDDPATDSRQVRKLEPGSPAGGAVVDSGLGIAEGSLALSSSSGEATPFYWQRDGAVFAGLLH
jgi:hypothetical protein